MDLESTKVSATNLGMLAERVAGIAPSQISRCGKNWFSKVASKAINQKDWVSSVYEKISFGFL